MGILIAFLWVMLVYFLIYQYIILALIARMMYVLCKKLT